MPAERVAMRKIREVLRLHHACGLSKRKIAPLVGIGPTAVRDYIRRAKAAGLDWPLPDDLDNEALERQLFPPPPSPIAEARPVPDWPTIARELRRKSVTLRLLWEEYRIEHQDGFGYSWFCDMFRAWQGRLSPTMRQEHRAGEHMLVDFAGQTMPIVTAATGEVRDAEIFIAVLGASNFTFVTARWSQRLPDWIGAHVDAFAAFGGVAAQVVCDNLRSGVTKASRYEPALNPTYREMAEHYGTEITPTRPRKPRDKAKVEVAVQVVERWVLARLRNRTFFSLAELNQELRRLTDDLNARVMRHLGVSRRELFERLDRPALRPLPKTPFNEELVLLASPQVTSLRMALGTGDTRIVVLRAGCSYRQRLERILADRGIQTPRLLEFGTLEAIFRCVSAGLGVTLLPRGVVDRIWDKDLVSVHDLPRSEAQVQTLFIRRHDSFVSSTLAAFLDFTRPQPDESNRP